MKEQFKYLIKEFHEKELPQLYDRDLVIPATNKIVTIVGSRRAGKTCYFYQLIKKLQERIPKERILYVNFEDDRILPLQLKDMDNLLEAYYELYPENKGKELYLFFDEVQNASSWELYVRRIYDKEKIKIWLTGSNAKLLSREIATSLRGRTLTFTLFPLNFREFLRFHTVSSEPSSFYSQERFKIKKLFEKYLIWGGFPEVVLEKNNLEQKILNDYFEMVLYRDVAERFSIRNVLLLKMLSKFLLTNVSSPFSINAYYNTVKQHIAVSKETIFEFLSYLEEANMIFLEALFSYSLKKQQANPKKIYCIDNGLRNAVSFLFSKDEGRLAENMVFLELKRREEEPYYWKNKGEVDFIIQNRDNLLTAINVTYTDEINERETKALLEWKQEFGKKAKNCLIITKDTEKMQNGIQYVPLWKWLLS